MGSTASVKKIEVVQLSRDSRTPSIKYLKIKTPQQIKNLPFL